MAIRNKSTETSLMALSSTSAAPRSSQYTWIPVVCGIAIICLESTNQMAAGQTDVWLHALLGQGGNTAVGLLNHYLRKGGYFTGYGLLGLFFTSGWLSVLRRRFSGSWRSLRFRAVSLGVASTLAVATADELHQITLPSRRASISDVLLATCGALTLNLIVFGYLALRRNALLRPGPVTTLGLSFVDLPWHWTGSSEIEGHTPGSNYRHKAVQHPTQKVHLRRFTSVTPRVRRF
jgi:hypothetical protein